MNSASIRVVIVDDEPLARDRLRRLLRDDPNVDLVGESANGRDAVQLIRATAPDLAFLDVQMPELNGFEVLASLNMERLPAIVFVTAFDNFAIKAFEVHALDYLLKPFDRDRFQKALARAVEHIRRGESSRLSERLLNLVAEIKPKAEPPERLTIRLDRRTVILKTREIDWIESADNYVRLHLGKASYLYRQKLSALEKQLAPRFIRISRSVIVNGDQVKELEPMFHGDSSVLLLNGTRLTMTRGYRENFNAFLGQNGGQ